MNAAREREGFKVNFLLAGVQKGGTTALSTFLGQHPDICMAPCKEVHFFDRPDYEHLAGQGELDRTYRKAFPNYEGQVVVGEATPIYIYWPWAPERIFRYNPNMKILIILRSPMERAISHYHMERFRGNEKKNICMAFLMEPFVLHRYRKDQSSNSPLRVCSYLSRGFYARQIRRLLEYFPEKNVRLVWNKDLKENHAATLDKIFDFLEVPKNGAGIERKNIFQGKYSTGFIENIIIFIGRFLYFYDCFILRKKYGHLVL
ncbi:sulfotransferase domain-containing protein [Geothermobacter ehrlichii]|nr:sulfotransferase domain-containing protein [Geothermobacter ehrlichii]